MHILFKETCTLLLVSTPLASLIYNCLKPDGKYSAKDTHHLKHEFFVLARLDLRFRSETTRGQLGPWPLGLNGNAMACFYNDTPLSFIGKGDSHFLQHILTIKVDAENIPNTRLGSPEK